MRLHTAVAYKHVSVLRGRVSSDGGWVLLLSVGQVVVWQTWFWWLGSPLAEARSFVAVSMAGKRRGGHEGAAHRCIAVPVCGQSWGCGAVGVRNWDGTGAQADQWLVR